MTTKEDRHALRLGMRRGEITAVYDSEGQQLVDVLGLDGEVFRGIYRQQIFGETSNPPVGTTGLLLFISGYPNQGVFIAGEDPTYRPRDIGVGGKAIYDQFGNQISLINDPDDGPKIRINTLQLDILGALVRIIVTALQISADVVVDGAVLLRTLPTVDPGEPGQLWNSGGTVKVSI